MYVIRGRNVNDIYPVGRGLLDTDGVAESTRAGDVLVMPGPVTSVYTRPQERVLFDAARDCNPFFHLFESLWMLAGRQDATWLDQFVGDFSSRYAESDGHMHGAYGYRWRQHFKARLADSEPIDQLSEIIRLLRTNKADRQCVIQMWDAQSDLGVPGLKDRPCNTQLYLRVRKDMDRGEREVLDMTICCRSNDVIWGAYGANAVHMSILQEYLAAGIGVMIGTMYQISNNFHGYCDILGKKPYQCSKPNSKVNVEDPYFMGQCVPKDMVTDFKSFDKELSVFMENPSLALGFQNEFFDLTAAPMYLAHQCWKAKDIPLMEDTIKLIDSSDWQLACQQWLDRRKNAAAARRK